MTEPEGQAGTRTALSDTVGHCSLASVPGHAASCGAIFVVCEGVECLHTGEHFSSLLSLDCEKDPKEARDIPLIYMFKKIQTVFLKNQAQGL